MKRLLILASLIVVMAGCELHAGWGHHPNHRPNHHGEVIVTTPAPSVIVSSQPEPMYVDEYHDDCYGDCCWYYDYYDAYPYVEVCETMECFDAHSGYYEFAGQDCWYE
jgi:hypothetical protein